MSEPKIKPKKKKPERTVSSSEPARAGDEPEDGEVQAGEDETESTHEDGEAQASPDVGAEDGEAQAGEEAEKSRPSEDNEGAQSKSPPSTSRSRDALSFDDSEDAEGKKKKKVKKAVTVDSKTDFDYIQNVISENHARTCERLDQILKLLSDVPRSEMKIHTVQNKEIVAGCRQSIHSIKDEPKETGNNVRFLLPEDEKKDEKPKKLVRYSADSAEVDSKKKLATTRFVDKLRMVPVGEQGRYPSTMGLMEKAREVKKQRETKKYEGGAHGHEDTRNFVQRIVFSKAFMISSILLILSNTVYVGIQTEVHIQESFEGESERFDFMPYEIVFCVLFGVELILRFVAVHPSNFFCGLDYTWNWFDLLLVAVSIFDVIASSSEIASIGMLKVLRLARIIRFVRVFRLAKKIALLEKLSAMLYTLRCSIGSFMPALLLIMITVYIFGVSFLQGVSLHMEKSSFDDETFKHMQQYFGSSTKVCWTLISSICGGSDWAGVADPLSKIGYLYVALFLFFVCFCMFCLLNILTATFVDFVHQASSMNLDLAIDLSMSEKKAYMEQLFTIFCAADVNDDGNLSREAFHMLLQDSRVGCFLGSLGIDAMFVDRFFACADVDGNGCLDLAEFVDVLWTMKVNAKISHIRILQDDMRKLDRKVSSIHSICKAFTRGIENKDFEVTARNSVGCPSM